MLSRIFVVWTAVASLVVVVLPTATSMETATTATETPPNCMLQWLKSLGFEAATVEKYATEFGKEAVDEQVLKQITLGQLTELGVSRYGERVLIHNSARAGSSACENGGTCVHVPANNAFSCKCPKGFDGSYCSNVNGCGPNICLNNGTCSEGNRSVSCQCPPGFIGRRCQNNNCDTQPCQNGGTCTPLSGGYSCSCPPGYEGTHCERAWLNSDEYVQMRQQISRATLELRFLKQMITRQKLLTDQAVLRVLDGVLAVEGPRFFKEWLEIDFSNISYASSFKIGGKLFLGAINADNIDQHQGVIIYEIANDSVLVHVQTITVENPVSFKSFSTDTSNHFLAVANHFCLQSDVERSPSKLYRWNGTWFEKVQDFPLKGVKDIDFISIPNSGKFLVFSGYHNGQSYDTPSSLYYWKTPNLSFVPYQKIPTTGAQKVHFLTVESETYLTVASEYDGDGNGHTNSSVFRWNGIHFDLFQLIPTYRAHDLYPFKIGCQIFLVAANFQNNIHNTTSNVYRLDNGRFVEHASIKTNRAVAVESFTIESEHFLAVANSFDEDARSPETKSIIYKITGPSLVPFQEVPTSSASHIHAFTLKQSPCKALVVSNKDGKAKLYKWTRVSITKNSCCK